MRILLPGLLLLWPLPAHAMNWEGHDDWMADMEPALIYQEAAPHAVPRRGDDCPASRKEAKDAAEDNVYEQIPFAVHTCPASPPAAEPER